jgi:AsmA protein
LLVRPTIDFKIDAEGRRNWTFTARSSAEAAAATAGSVSAPAGPAAPPLAHASRNAGVASALDRLSLENVEISDGTLRYRDERIGRSKEVTAIELK